MIELNRPERLNTLTMPLVVELVNCLEEVGRDADTRVVVLTGAGDYFCAGADLDVESDDDGPSGAVSMWDAQKAFSECVLTLRSLPQPVIAAVNGAAAGGGLALALGCDIRLASDTSRFAASFVRVGLSGCDMGTSWHLARLVGTGRAHELLLTGRHVDADEALRIGLVTKVVAREELLPCVLQQAELIIRNSPLGVAMTKDVMWATTTIDHLHDAIALENRTQVMLTQTADFAEAVAAFSQKRMPSFHRS